MRRCAFPCCAEGVEFTHPDLVENLFSVRKQILKGLVVKFDVEKLEIIDSQSNEI